MTNKIIRSLCYFNFDLDKSALAKLTELEQRLIDHDFMVQTKRICIPTPEITDLYDFYQDTSVMYSVGTLDLLQAEDQLRQFIAANVPHFFNLDLTHEAITLQHVNLLFKMVEHDARKTFNFTYTFNNQPSSPYFPSANYQRTGFSLGLQSPDLADGCKTLEEWLKKMEQVWFELFDLFQDNPEFLGIDASIAPLFEGKSSLIYFLKMLGIDFNHSFTTPFWTTITSWLKTKNPKPIGLNGLMLPCLEDFELAREYEAGNFNIERNIFASLHSGLGIDTYPIGIDEKKERVLEILQLVQALSLKHNKPLSVRFVSDGKTKIGQKTDFQNKYLYDVTLTQL